MAVLLRYFLTANLPTSQETVLGHTIAKQTNAVLEKVLEHEERYGAEYAEGKSIHTSLHLLVCGIHINPTIDGQLAARRS